MVATAPFPGRPFQLRVVGGYSGSDAQANRSLVTWEIWIDKLSYSPTWSGEPASSWAASVSGTGVGGASGIGFDFRNGNNFLLGSGNIWIAHNPDGTAPAADVYAWADYASLGYAQAHDYVALPQLGGTGGKGPYIASAASWKKSITYVASAGTWRRAIPYVYSAGSGGWKRIK